MTLTCPCCGAPTTVPQLFTFKRQQVFFYVWDNPRCSQEEIRLALYPHKPRQKGITSVSEHLTLIRAALRVGGLYQLHTTMGQKPWTYKIIHQKPTPKESADGIDKHNRRLP